MAIDFNKTYPWSDIETVTIDGQIMVKIPKFYVKYDTIPAGRDNAGKKAHWVSERHLSGYHCHPAFIRNGEETDCFYIAAYEAYNAGSGKAGSAANQTPWVNITNPAAITACAARNTDENDNEKKGWHLQNIYERAAISLLILIELGTPDVQTAIGAGKSDGTWNNKFEGVLTGGSNAVWRGIHEFWGNVWEHTDGFKTDANKIGQIFSNQGTETYVSTGVTVAGPTSGGAWIKEVSEAKGANFDLSDVFVPTAVDTTEGNGTFADAAWCNSNCVLYQSGSWHHGSRCGAFAFDVDTASSHSNANIGFRLAKYGFAES